MSEIKATDLVIDENRKIQKDVDSVSVKVVEDMKKENKKENNEVENEMDRD